MKHIDVNKTVLKNGLRVISVQKESDIFSMGIGINAGSLYEDEAISGVSHMVEHMLFKGTANRTMDRLNDDLETLAGDLDIYTTYHRTALNISVMKERAGDCIEVISDMLMNAAFPRKEFNLEKKVIMEEIKMEKDDSEDMAYQGLHKAAFPDCWHKYHIAGTLKSIRGIKCHMLGEFYNTYYVPGNTAICVVSPYSHEEIVDMVSACLGDWRGEKTPCLPRWPRSWEFMKVIRRKEGIGQSHILYGFDISHLDRKEQTALALLNKRIGSGANSVLFRELRDNKGYAYAIYSDMDFIRGVDMFYIYAAVSPDNLKDTMSIIDSTLERFRQGDILMDERVIRLIKDTFLTDAAIAMESPSHIVDYILDGELDYNNPLEYQKVLSAIESMKLDDITGVIGRVLKDPIVHVLSPK